MIETELYKANDELNRLKTERSKLRKQCKRFELWYNIARVFSKQLPVDKRIKALSIEINAKSEYLQMTATEVSRY
jgi:SMC interacting uncharacterized protein involved in chromosome segregation